MYMGLSANNSNMVIISPKRTLCFPSSFLKLHKNHPSSTKTIILNPLLVHNNYGLNINSNAARIGISTSTTIISASSSAARTLPDADADADVDVVVVESNNTTATTSTKWSEFATKVSGEWDGYGADFTKDGEPIELPESVVPEAYREWEVKVFDWQTQCPTLAQQKHEVEVEVEVEGDVEGDGDSLLIYKFIKLLPTAGCEADAATRYNIDVRIVGGAHTNVSAFAYQPTTGCYVAVWPILDQGQGQGHPYRLLELEHCLMDPRNQESPSRVRIIQVVRVQNNTKLVLQNIKIFCEQWYGPFRNGDQLGGCAIRDSAFASTQALKSSEIIGVWQGPHAVANFKISQTNIIQQLVDGSVRTSVRNESNLVLLPKQLWCSVEEIEDDDDETCFEVGWLLDQGRAITSKCILSSNANLKEIAVASEAAALAQ